MKMFSARAWIPLVLFAVALGPLSAQDLTIVHTVVSRQDLSLLTELVTKAGLGQTLQGAGIFTLFAPDNSAFSTLNITNHNLLSKLLTVPIGPWHRLLVDIVNYHVLADTSSEVYAADLADEAEVVDTMSPGSRVSLDASAPEVEAVFPAVGSANIQVFDRVANNGVVHVVDTVLLPPSTQRTVWDIIEQNMAPAVDFYTLRTLLQAAEMTDLLQSNDPDTALTFFAPTSGALAVFHWTVPLCLARPENKVLVQDFVKAHLLKGKQVVATSDLSDGDVLTSRATVFRNNTYTYRSSPDWQYDVLHLGPARKSEKPIEILIQAPDILASNGIVHVIDHPITGPDFYCPRTVVTVMKDSEDHTVLSDLVARAEMEEYLSGNGPPLPSGKPRENGKFTIFGPTDEAFEQLGEGILVDKLMASPIGPWRALARDVLQAHMLREHRYPTFAADLPNVTTVFPVLAPGAALELVLPPVEGAAVRVAAVAPGVGAGRVVEANLAAFNGVVHATNAVVLPPSTQRNLVDLARAMNLTTFVSLVETADIDALLEREALDSAHTVFAPTDEAFERMGEQALTCLRTFANKNSLQNLLKMHVLSGVLMAGELADGARLTTLSTLFDDNDIRVMGQAAAGTATLQSSGPDTGLIRSTDMLATTGVLHTVDRVLLPADFSCPFSTFDVIAGSEAHNLLQNLFDGADLVETISARDGEYTVLAPTNDALERLPHGLKLKLAGGEPQWRPLLREVLLNHVFANIDAIVTLSRFPAFPTNYDTMAVNSFITLNQQRPELVAPWPGRGAANITQGDIRAGNGIVHVISAVLLPAVATRTVATVANSTEMHHTLSQLLHHAGLAAALNEQEFDSAFTLFAPTDTAFSRVDSKTLECLLIPENNNLLEDLLLFHVSPGVKQAADVRAAGSLRTLARGFLDNSISVTEEGGLTPAGGLERESSISGADLLTANGVVHIVDRVLIPAGFYCEDPNAPPIELTTPPPNATAAASGAAPAVLVVLASAAAAALYSML